MNKDHQGVIERLYYCSALKKNLGNNNNFAFPGYVNNTEVMGRFINKVSDAEVRVHKFIDDIDFSNYSTASEAIIHYYIKRLSLDLIELLQHCLLELVFK